MTWIDVVIALSLIVYTALGAYTRTWRRVLGFVGIYLGLGAATYAAPRLAGMIQPDFNIPLVDVRLYCFFGVAGLVVLLLELIAAAYHRQLEISYVALDYGTGVLLGAFTGLLVAGLTVLMLDGASHPSGGSDGLQLRTHDAIAHSTLVPILKRTAGKAGEALMQPVLPRNPIDYFQFDSTPKA